MNKKSLAITGIVLLIGLSVYSYSLRVECRDSTCEGDCFCEGHGFDSMGLCSFACHGYTHDTYCPDNDLSCAPSRI